MDIRETPWLTPESVSFLEDLIKCNPDIKILEFGCGGSTIWFSRLLKSPNARVVSVEHDAEWQAAVKETVGSNVDLRHLPRPYSSVCDEFPDNYFDLVLIDGRDRILCAAKSMRLVKHGGFMMLDNADRRIYAPIEEVLLKEWPFKRTAAYNCPEAAENNGWFTDIWRRPTEKNTANVPDDQLVSYGEDFARKGDYQNAETFARISLEANCRIADALNLLGVVSSAQDNQLNALELFEAGRAQEPDHLNIGKNLAATYSIAGRYEDAATIYSYLLNIYPDDADLIAGMKKLSSKSIAQPKPPFDNITAPALKTQAAPGLRAMVKVDLTNPQQAIEIARGLFAHKEYNKAFDIYEQLLTINPQDNIALLAEIYDCYKSIDQLDRYSLYQSRLFDFGIKPGDKVLDIGSGNAPFVFATHLADFSIEDNELGRNGAPFKYLDGKPVYECNIENMPFADNEFDFVYCSHVLEHVSNPEAACRELMRIARRGYIETPNISKDLILNVARVSNHRWSIELFNDTLTFSEYSKRQIEGICSAVIGHMHLYPESVREKAITALIYLKADLFNTMLLWDGAFKFEVRRLEGAQTAITQPQIRQPDYQPAAVAAETFTQTNEPATVEWLQEMTFKINQAQGDAAKLVKIGGQLAENGEDVTAEQLARMIIGQNPQYSDAYNLLGIIYFNRGEATAAQRYFETARRFEPNNTDISKNLVAVYTQLEEYEKAIEVCQSMLAASPNDPELPEIIGNLLETVSERALTGVNTCPNEESTTNAECRPAAAHLVKFYSDMRFLPQGQRHITPLAPFWGITKDDAIEEGRFTRLYDTVSEFISLAPLDDADAVLLPFDYIPGGHPYAHEMAEIAATAGKPILLFFGQDSTEEINVNNSIIFRTSFYKSTRKKNEFAMPAFCVDFIERYLDSRIPLKRKADKPAVAFCGSVATDPSNTRGRSLEALAKSPLVNTSFVVRDGFWGSISEDSAREVTREEYVQNMVDADYVLCTRGTGNFSFRLYETLSCGRIPVFVDTDAVLPFEEFIDWKKYCVWVDQSEVDQIAQKVADFHASLTPEEFYDMQYNCRMLWEQWLSPHGFYSNLWRYLPVSEKKQSPASSPLPSVETPYEAEKEVCEAIRRFVKPGSTCVDIGANVGLLTKFLSQLSGPGGRIIAFEPHPDNVSEIKNRLSGRDNIARVSVESMAVSDGSAESLPLYAGRNQSCFEWNLMGHDVDGNPTSAVLDVPTTSLDKYFKPGEKIDFIKIDVEGAFAMVAAGMKRVLKKSRPTLMIEFHDDIEWAARAELIKIGYELQDMNGNPVEYGEGAKRVYHCMAVPSQTNPKAKKTAKSSAKDKEVQPEVVTEHSCMFINTCYPEFLNGHYAKNPNLTQASYETQKASLEETFFGDANFYSNGMQQAGWHAENLIVNCMPIQQAWAIENDFSGSVFDVTVEQIRRKRPSVVYLQNLALATPEFLRAIRPHTKLIVGQIASPVPHEANVKGLDIIFSSFPHFVEQFRKMGITSYYQPLAFDPRVLDKIKSDDKRLGATFVGVVSKSHGKGTEFLEKVSSMMPMDVWGYGVETLDPDSPLRKAHHGEAWGLDMFSLLGQSKVTINRHIDVAENNANNMRLFEATGCGALLITDYKDNLEDLFEIGREVVAYRTPEECAVLTKYYLDHPDEAEQIAKAGQERTLKDHTYTKRMQQTAEILSRHLRYQHESERLGSIDISNISSDYAMIGKSQISESMIKGWQDENIPAKQRALVQPQLEAMYKGNPDQNFQVLTEILRPHVYPGCSILEVGCASGYYYEILEYMLNKQIEYTGADYSEPLINMAKDYYPNVDFRAADGANMPFEDRKFEIAISSGVLLHVPNYADHIKETARVANHLVVAHRTPVCRQRPTQYYTKRAYGAETVEMRFNEDEFISLFAQNGLELINAFEYYWQPQNDIFDVTYLFRKKEK